MCKNYTVRHWSDFQMTVRTPRPATMPIGRVFYALLLAAHFLALYGKLLQNTCRSNNISDTRSFLLTESHVLPFIGMDADGLKWTFTQDKMTRRHVGFGATNGARLSHKWKPFTTLGLSLILISGDILTIPGTRCFTLQEESKRSRNTM